MQEQSDEALMQAYANGDPEAFDRLYARHRGPLYRYVLHRVGDAATANDLYQGAWEKIIRARRSYRPSAPFRAWMFRIAHNHVMDHFRSAKPETDLPADHLESPGAGPEQQNSEAERNAVLERAVAMLPAEQREAILLRLEGGFDLQAIADITGVNRETAKSRLRYAVDKLKTAMQD